VSEFREIPHQTIPEIVGYTGVTYPNPHPYTDCSLVMVLWNEEARIGSILDRCRPYFERFVIGVQESTDQTLDIVQKYATEKDQVIPDRHWGFGDASMPMLISAAKTDWVFVVAGDEMPSDDLLDSLWSATAYAHKVGADSVWVPFVSLIEDIEYDEQHGHLRLFQRKLGWPHTLHSRPMSSNGIWWPIGHIRHERSLDEMVQDYLRYFERGQGNPGWDRHNLTMIHDACVAVANRHGWDYVTRYPWWPEAKRLAFANEE
jgi:glycosyltransferase involved in cell wall biosynthesis